MSTRELDLRSVLGPLVKVLASLVAEELGRRDAPNRYSTAPGQWPPRSRSRRHARDRIRAVPGHQREGDGCATEWSIDAETFERHHTHRPPVRVLPQESATTDEQIAEAALANFRPTKRTA